MMSLNHTTNRILSLWIIIGLALTPPLRAGSRVPPPKEGPGPPERYETNQYLRELPDSTYKKNEEHQDPASDDEDDSQEEPVQTLEEWEELEEPPIHFQTNQFLRELPPATFDIEETETQDRVPANLLYMSIIMAGMFVLGQFVTGQDPGKTQAKCLKTNSLHDRK